MQEDTQQDLLATLQKVAAMGYQGVEFAGYFDHSAEEIKAELTRLNLTVAAPHISYQALFDKLEETLAFEKVLGNKNIVIPYATFVTQAEWLTFIAKVKTLLPKIKAAGFTLLYHNHAHEFSEIPDFDALEALCQAIPELKLEVDLYWLAYAGIDVVTWLDERQQMIKLLHLKDMQENPQESTIIGKGILLLENYLAFAKVQGLEWIIVEQEAFQGIPPLTAVAEGYQNLKKML